MTICSRARVLRSVVVMVVSALAAAACAVPLAHHSEGLHELSGHVAIGAYGPGCDPPNGVYYSPEAVCADRVVVGSGGGLAASYARRLRQGPAADGHGWLGTEIVAAWIPYRPVTVPQADHPDGVSTVFAAVLLKGHISGLEDRWPRVELGAGAGVGFGVFRETGKPDRVRLTDRAIGPAVGTTVGYWLSEGTILRANLYLLFVEPTLSFEWQGPTGALTLAVVKAF